MKIVILLILLVIGASLGSGLYFLLKDKERSPRTVKALTTRIVLSIALFVLLLIAFQSGLIRPHGIRVSSELRAETPVSSPASLP